MAERYTTEPHLGWRIWNRKSGPFHTTQRVEHLLTTKAAIIDGYPVVASCDQLGWQQHYSAPNEAR